MIRLSIQARQALVRLTLPVLILASFGIMLLGKADTMMADRARVALADGLAPIYAVVAAPLGRVHDAAAEIGDRKDRRKHTLQPIVLALLRKLVHLQKALIRPALHFNQIRNLDAGWDL